MADEVHELAVKMVPDGMEEVNRELDKTGSQFDETAQSVGASAGEMEGFAQSWAGAMTAIVAGLAVAAAGLLAQVPVVGELMSGLVSVIEAVAFQMDSVLRPILMPLTDALFDLSAAIFEAEGIMGTIVGVIGTVVAILATVIPIVAAVGAQLGVFASTGAGVISILGTIVGAVGAVVAAIASLPVIVIVAIAAIIALAAAFIFNVGGIRDKTISFISDLVDTTTSLLSGWADTAIGFAKDIWDGVTNWIGNVVSDARDLFDKLVSDAKGWGSDLLDRFVSGLKSAFGRLQRAIDSARQRIADALSFDIRANDRMAERWGEDLMQHFAIGQEVGARTHLPGGEEAVKPEPQSAFSGGGESKVSVFLDGREASRATKRYSDDATNRRGVFGQ